jgi:hypothetical protein
VTIDLDAAKAFMAGHARALDRHRLSLVLGEGEAARPLAALGAYRNPDGGYGWGLEPDLRSVSSQPVGAMHAMEVFAECGPSVTSRRAVELCDWLEGRTLADGGLPLALPVDDPAGSSPIWTSADPSVSTLQMTSQVAAHAHRLAPHQPEVADHPWLAVATRYCLEEIRRMDREPQAHELMFSIAFLDAAAQRLPEADELLDNLGRHIPDDSVVRVQGGTEDEALHPTQLSPWPGLPSRRLFSEHVIDADLERLAGLQQRDGGWTVDFEPASAAAALEWRGYATAQAIAILKRNGVLVR